MLVSGSDCSIVIKTTHYEKDIPYSEETIREAVSFLQEEASIEGDGVCRGIRKSTGVVGCVVTPLTLGTAPLLLYLAMGSAGKPAFVSETRDLYQYQLKLVPIEDTERFDLIQERGDRANKVGLLYEVCAVKGFELRFVRGEAVKLKLDICGEYPPRVYPYIDPFIREWGERFSGDYTSFWINGKNYQSIYGVTLTCKKEGGAKTELWIKRVLEKGEELPPNIEELTISAQLLKDSYELRHFGTFRITIKHLVLIADEIDVNTADAVVGPLRYYVAGTVNTEVFTYGAEIIP